MRNVILAICIVFNVVGAEGIKVMFVGLNKGKAELFGKRYESDIRQLISSEDGYSIMDYVETERLIKKAGLRNYPAISLSFVNSLKPVIMDTTLVLWGRVREHDISAHRKGIFRAQVTGNAAIDIMLYSLQAGKFVFVGKISASSSVKKPPAWFRRASLVTHISSQDRETITDDLVRQTSEKTMSLISAVVRSINAVEEEIAMERERVKKEIPELNEFDNLLESLENKDAYEPEDTSQYEVYEIPETDGGTSSLENLPSIDGFPPLEAEGQLPLEGEAQPGDGLPVLEGESLPPVEGDSLAPLEGESLPPLDGFPSLEGDGLPPLDGGTESAPPPAPENPSGDMFGDLPSLE